MRLTALNEGQARFASAWEKLDLYTPETLLAARHLHGQGLDEIVENAGLITDYHNRLKYAAPRILGQPAGKAGFVAMLGDQDSILTAQDVNPAPSAAALLHELGHGSPVRARRYTTDDPAGLSLVNTWHYRGDGETVDLTWALRDERYADLARGTLLRRYQDQLMRGEVLPRVRAVLRPNHELKFLELMQQMRSGNGEPVRNEREWLEESILPSSPLFPLAIQLMAQAAWSTRDVAWATELLATKTTALVDFPPLRFRLAMLSGRIPDALSALRGWRQRIGRQVPGEPFRQAVESLRSRAPEVVDGDRGSRERQRFRYAPARR